MSIRDERAVSLIVQAAANYIKNEAGRQTLITPTRGTLSKDRKRATIYLSVFPDNEAEHALAFLNRHTDDFRSFLKKEMRLPVIPFVSFEIDFGEKNRQHLDDLSKEVDSR